jgi:hypothetical protein
MQFVTPIPLPIRKTAARKIIEIANVAEAAQDGRMYIERVNGAFRCRRSKKSHHQCRPAKVHRPGSLNSPARQRHACCPGYGRDCSSSSSLLPLSLPPVRNASTSNWRVSPKGNASA